MSDQACTGEAKKYTPDMHFAFCLAHTRGDNNMISNFLAFGESIGLKNSIM